MAFPSSSILSLSTATIAICDRTVSSSVCRESSCCSCQREKREEGQKGEEGRKGEEEQKREEGVDLGHHVWC